MEELIHRVQRSQHGFLDIQKAADEVVIDHPAEESYHLALVLFSSEVHQARGLATFIFGRLSSRSPESLAFLKQQVSLDRDWRVQEILAKAFDRYCADTGYEQALPAIREWLADPCANVRRAVTEGLRIWTGRPYFQDHPESAVQFLSALRTDASEYVRRSVGNALRDISKRHGELVRNELKCWDLRDRRTEQTYKLAGRFLDSIAGNGNPPKKDAG